METNMNRPKKNGSKNMMYEQQLRYLPTGTIEKLVECIENELQPKRYALAVHNKDVAADGKPAEAHVHVMLCFSNARSWANVAKILRDKPQQVQYWDNRVENGMSYLLHATKGAKGKHPYDPGDVIANFDFPSEYAKITEAVERATKKQSVKVPFLLDAMYAGAMTKEEVEARLSGSQYARYHRQIDEVWSKRLENQAAEWRKAMIAQGKQVTVWWLYGESGTGKTSLARALAEQRGQEYFISGSSRDIFQRYSGQHTLILDELRPRVIEYQDLLRLTDPFGIVEGVMAPSRYFDKALACDLIIITSPYDPKNFYDKQFGVGYTLDRTTRLIDSFGQLARRITVAVEMIPGYMYLSEYDTYYQSYLYVESSKRPNPYSSAARPVPENNSMDIYNSIFE